MVCMLLMISAVSAETNDTMISEDSGQELSVYADNQLGNDLNSEDISAPAESISHMVENAGNNSDIHLGSDTYSGSGNTRITIDKSLNFIGDNTVIDGEGKDYLFTITGNAKVTFKNIIFKNAYKSPESYAINYPDSVYGAALEIKSGNVILDNCTFQSNVVDYSNNNRYTYGGAISNEGTLTIINSRFISNIAHSTSGLFSYGGSIYNNGKLSITGSEFLKSSSDDFSYGGFIYNNNELIMESTLVTGSFSAQESRGGAIYNAGNFRLFNSIIENNIVSKANFQYVYGTVYNSGTLVARGNIFRNNTGLYSVPSRGSANVYSVGILNMTYNLFLGNAPFEGISKDVYINSGEIVSLDNNWWGSNENPYSTGAINLDENINSWLVLDITPEYSSLNIGETATITTKWTSNIQIGLDTGMIPKTEILINNNSYTLSNQLIYTYTDTQTKGMHNVSVVFSDFVKIIEVDVGKIKTTIAVNANDNMSYMDDLNINVNVRGNDGLNPDGMVIISIDNKAYNIALENGHANYVIHGLNPGSYDLKVSYNGSENYFKSFHVSKVTVNKRSVFMNLTIPEFFIDESFYITVGLQPEGSKSQAILYIDGVKKKNIYLYDNQINRIPLTGFGEGEYNITIAYLENTYFKSSNVSGILKIKKYTPVFNITAPDIYLGNTQTVKITVTPGDVRGGAILNINGNNYLIFLNDTTTSITIPNLKAGDYHLNLVFDGNSKYSKAVASASFSVLKYPSSLDVKVNYDETTFKGNVIVKTNNRNCTGEISVMINFKIYTMNLVNGQVDIPVSYDKGTNYIYVYYGGDSYWAESDWNTTIGVADEFILMSGDVTGYEHNDFNYSFRLIEPSGVPLPSRVVTVKFNNALYDVKTDDDGFGYFKLNLASGIYEIHATYKNQTVNNTLEVKKIVFNVTATNATYGNELTFTAEFEKDVKGRVNFTINNVLNEVVDIVDGKAILNANYLNVGTYTVYAHYTNEHFNSTDKSCIFRVDKSDTRFDMAVSNVITGEDADITLVLSDNASGEAIFVLDGQMHVVPIMNNKAVLTVLNISGAGHTINITYAGDRNYNPNSLNASFYIKDLRSGVALTLENITYGETFNVTARVDDNATGNVTFIIGDIIKTVDINDSKAVLRLDNLGAGNYTMTAVYNGNTYYISSENSTQFTVSKAASTIRIEADACLGENVLIYAYLSPGATGVVSFSMPGYYTSRDKIIDDSIALWYISPLDTGTYTVKALYKGDSNYLPSNTSYLINISQKKTRFTVEIKDVTVDERVTVSVTLTSGSENLTDKVTVRLNSREYTVTVRNGKGNLVIGKLPIGVYDYEAIYEGNENYTRERVSGSFRVDEMINVTLNARNITMYYKGSQKLEVTLTDASRNPLENQIINIRLNNKDYQLTTDSEGKVYLDLDLNVGNYTASVSYAGTDKYRSKAMEVSVEVKTTVTGIDVTKLYGTSTQYFAIFLDSNGRALADTKVTFKIADRTFTATTLPNGISRLNVNFEPGNYIIEAINPSTGEIAKNKIYIFNRLMENSDVTQNYCEGKSYKARAYDDQGNVVGAGEKVTVKLAGKTYSLKTDKNGYVSVKISLKPGTYTITASYGGVTVKNKVVVKSIIKAKNVKVKKKAKAVKFKVSLKKVNGKYLKGKKLTLKLKGKKITAKTSKKGVATFKIKKSILKKLKKGKKYTYRVTYLKDSVKRNLKVK